MKIESLLQEGITVASDPANATSSAPKFGRDEDTLEETTSSGSVATVAQPMGGMQRRGKGSIFSGIKTSQKFPNSKAVKEGAYEDGVSDGMSGKSNPRASSIYGPETSQYSKGLAVGAEKAKQKQQASAAQASSDKAPYEKMSDEELIQLRKEIQQRTKERQEIYSRTRTPANSIELKQQNQDDNKAWNIINSVLWNRGVNIDKLKESDDVWGPQGNFAGDKHVDVGGVSMKPIQVGDAVRYFGQKSEVVAMSKDRKYSRITIESGMGSITKDVLTKDLQQLGQGVAEAGKLKGTPVVSLGDLGDKDNTKDKYGRTVPKKLKKDDPRVKFHKDYSKHEKKLISKMSNAEKVDKGWRNPNIDEQGVAEGMERLDPFTRTVINYMEDNSWLTAERAYFRAIGLEKKKQMNPHRWAEEVQYYIDRYNEYKGVSEEKQRLDPKCWDGYKKQGTKMKGGVRVNNCVPAESVSEDQLDEKSVSKAQFRTMAAVAHNPEFAKKVGISQKVGKEFHKADRKQDYKKLPAKVDEAELSEEQLLARELQKRLDLFKRGKDKDLSNRPDDKGVQKKQVDELFGFGKKPAPAPTKPMVSRVPTAPAAPGAQSAPVKTQTWFKRGKPYTLQFVNPGYTLIDPNGKEITRFNAPIRYIESHLQQNGFSLGNNNKDWFKV